MKINIVHLAPKVLLCTTSGLRNVDLSKPF